MFSVVVSRVGVGLENHSFPIAGVLSVLNVREEGDGSRKESGTYCSLPGPFSSSNLDH